MKNKTMPYFLVVVVLLGIGLSFSLPVFAEEQMSFQYGLDSVKRVAETNDLAQGGSSQSILQGLVKWFMSLIATIAMISLLYGGFLYITSQGEESQAEKAKTIILYSVIGLIVIGLSAIVVNVVISVATQ